MAGYEIQKSNGNWKVLDGNSLDAILERAMAGREESKEGLLRLLAEGETIHYGTEWSDKIREKRI